MLSDHNRSLLCDSLHSWCRVRCAPRWLSCLYLQWKAYGFLETKSLSIQSSVKFCDNSSFSLSCHQPRTNYRAHPNKTQFCVIDARTSYHMLFGRLWIRKHKVVSFMYISALKPWKDKKVHINASKHPFHRDEAHLLEAAFFNELAKGGDVIYPDSKVCLCRYGMTSSKNNSLMRRTHIWPSSSAF